MRGKLDLRPSLGPGSDRNKQDRGWMVEKGKVLLGSRYEGTYRFSVAAIGEVLSAQDYQIVRGPGDLKV